MTQILLPQYEFELPIYSHQHPNHAAYIEDNYRARERITTPIRSLINRARQFIDDELSAYRLSGREKQQEPRIKANPQHYSKIGTENYGVITHERVSYAIQKNPSLLTQISKTHLSETHLIYVASIASSIRYIPTDLLTDDLLLVSLVGGNQCTLPILSSTSRDVWFLQSQYSPGDINKLPPSFRTEEVCYNAFKDLYFGQTKMRFLPKPLRKSERFRQLVCRDFPIKVFGIITTNRTDGADGPAIREFGSRLSFTCWKCIAVQFSPFYQGNFEETLRDVADHFSEPQITELVAIVEPRIRQGRLQQAAREDNIRVNLAAREIPPSPPLPRFRDDAADQVARNVSKISIPADPGPLPTFLPPNGQIRTGGPGVGSCCICTTDSDVTVIECGGHPPPSHSITTTVDFHYYCTTCIVDTIRVQTDINAEDFDVSAWKRVGGIASCTFDGAPPVPFPPRLVSTVLTDAQYETYLKSRETFISRHSEQIAAFQALSEAQRAISDPIPRHITYIQDYILTTRCPKTSCRAPFDGFDGCAALTCGSCNIVFCAYCHSANASASIVHSHVRECTLNPSIGTFGGSFVAARTDGAVDAQNLEAVNLGKHQRVLKYLQSIEDASVRNQVVPTIVKDYRDIKMKAEWIEEISRM